MKTEEKRNAFIEKAEAPNKKPAELSEEEMETVGGGAAPFLPPTELAEEAYSGMPCGPREEPYLPPRRPLPYEERGNEWVRGTNQV